MQQRGGGAPSFDFIDLFAGIGGMRLALERLGGQCVFSVERDKFARKTYEANFECDHPFPRDIAEISLGRAGVPVPPHHFLAAGFPCQPFSLAGVSKKNSLGRPHGFECKTQGTLFFEIAQILKNRRPALFLLENVKNLRSHDGGRTFEIIEDTLKKDLKYHVVSHVVDARAFVPQHRERIFIAGFREPCGFGFDDLQWPDDEQPVLASILHGTIDDETPEEPYTSLPGITVSERYTLSEHLWEYLQAYAKKHRMKGNGFGYDLVDGFSVARTLSARYHKDGSEILVDQSPRPRRLTPRECSRLMGFDSFINGRFCINRVSDTQAYRQFGNAVVPQVVYTIARGMLAAAAAAGYPEFGTWKSHERMASA